MNFKRPIIFFILLCCVLIGGLIFTHAVRPRPNRLIGTEVFPIASNAITSISLNVEDESGQLRAVELKRQGRAWFFEHPYKGVLCNDRTIARILSATNQMKVLSICDAELASRFKFNRSLTLATVDKTYQCGFNPNGEIKSDRVAVATENEIVCVDAATIKQLPKTFNELMPQALLPFVSKDSILEMTWRENGVPFTRVYRDEVTSQKGDWIVEKADVFKKTNEVIAPLLEELVKKDFIVKYLTPIEGSSQQVFDHLSIEVLRKYGLDLDECARFTIRLREFKEERVFKFGHESVEAPGYIYCLIEHAPNAQSIVLVPKVIRTAFGEEGLFAVEYTNLAIVDGIDSPDIVDIRSMTNMQQANYIQENGTWVNKQIALNVDSKAMQSFIQHLLSLRGNLVAPNQPPMNDPIAIISLKKQQDASASATISFDRDENGDFFVYRNETKRLYFIKESDFPKALLSPNLAYDVLDKIALRVAPQTVKQIEIQQPEQDPITIVRDAEVASGWRMVQPVGAYVDVAVVNRWLAHLEKMETHSIMVKDDLFDVTAPWGYRSSGEPSYQLRLILDFNSSTTDLRKTIIFAESASEDGDVKMVVQGRTGEYLVAPEVVNDFKQLPFVYEER